jgi:L,D-transpeptidase-like protein/putative peptidoglycan binding protein
MAAGRHIARRRHRALLIGGVIVGVLVLLVGGAAFAAYRYEGARTGELPPGIVIGGLDVGGMTRGEAIAAVERVSSDRLNEPIHVAAGAHRWTVTRAELGQRARVRAAVDQAFALAESMGTWSRFWHRFRNEPVGETIDVSLVGGSRVSSIVRSMAAEVAVRPRNAVIGLRDDQVVFRKARAGLALDESSALGDLRSVLAEGRTRVRLAMDRVAPKVTPRRLGPTIVVRVNENRLYLYDGFHVEASWPVATAKPGYTTPDGVWRVWDKRENPTWYNPALDTWGADLPAVVPGGPGNPMGTRAIYIDAPGLIRVHGTSDPNSIGRYASHGCIRMQNGDVENLFEKVEVGMHVIIAGQRPAGAVEWDTPGTADI